MPDFREYVRRNLPLLGLPGEREAEIVEELALEFEENYRRATLRGLSPEDAFREVVQRAGPWPELTNELRSAFGVRRPTRPKNRKRTFLAELRATCAMPRASYGRRQLSRSSPY